MNFVQVRDLIINLDQIAYIDRSRCRIVLVGKIEIFLTQQEVEEVANVITMLLNVQQNQG